MKDKFLFLWQNSVILAILKSVSIFGHRLKCTKPESSRLQNIGVDSGLRFPDCDTGCRRTEAVSDCCLRRHKTQCDRQSCWRVTVCPLPTDDTLNTSFAEYLAFSLIFFIFYRCPINSVVPPCPAVRNLGARAPASSMAPAPMQRTEPEPNQNPVTFVSANSHIRTLTNIYI